MANVTKQQATLGILVVTAAATVIGLLLLRKAGQIRFKAGQIRFIADYDGIDYGC
jgi:hypothetical protein